MHKTSPGGLELTQIETCTTPFPAANGISTRIVALPRRIPGQFLGRSDPGSAMGSPTTHFEESKLSLISQHPIPVADARHAREVRTVL